QPQPLKRAFALSPPESTPFIESTPSAIERKLRDPEPQSRQRAYALDAHWANHYVRGQRVDDDKSGPENDKSRVSPLQEHAVNDASRNNVATPAFNVAGIVGRFCGRQTTQRSNTTDPRDAATRKTRFTYCPESEHLHSRAGQSIGDKTNSAIEKKWVSRRRRRPFNAAPSATGARPLAPSSHVTSQVGSRLA
ncbi:hypothetical protein MTO96_032585, partial [Rhipicephalus appendiculatus]